MNEEIKRLYERADDLLKDAEENGCVVPKELIIKAFNMAVDSQDPRQMLRVLYAIYSSGFVNGMQAVRKKWAIERLEREINENASGQGRASSGSQPD